MKIKLLLTSLIVAGTLAFSGESFINDHVFVNERPMNIMERARWMENLSKEVDPEAEEDLIEKCGMCHMRRPDLATHIVHEMGYQGLTCTLEDGSTWNIKPNEAEKIAEWPTETNRYPGEYPSLVFITQNTDFLKSLFSSNYNYKIVNKHTRESAHATMTLGPLLNECVSINNIDRKNGILYLDDGTQWNLSSFDSSVYKDWMPTRQEGSKIVMGDYIIIGVNNRWNCYWSPYLLINVTRYNHIRANLNN